MYTVVVEAGFSATHQVRLPDGAFEPLHGHDWKVRAHFARQELDALGMVVDFVRARAAIESVLGDLQHANLNEHEALAGRSPTAEVLAKHLFDRIRERGFSTLRRVEVTEAPGCAGAYEAAGG